MRYFGSKLSTAEYIFDIVSSRVPFGHFCDPFGGMGIVGSLFKKKGFRVWSGDTLTFAHYFQISRIQYNRSPSFRRLREHLGIRDRNEISYVLNKATTDRGWLIEEYSTRRGYFTQANAIHIQGCWDLLVSWSRNGLLSKGEKAYLLASLIDSMDAVANTAGTYYAYLKGWDRKAILPFQFRFLAYSKGAAGCLSFKCEASDLVSKQPYDVLYLDPPYNERNYSQYYHLPETIALCETPVVHGKSGVPTSRSISSEYYSRNRAATALQDLLSRACFRLLVFHYSDDGIIRPGELREVLSAHGSIEEHLITSKGYTTVKSPRTITHRLYLVNNG